MMWKFWRKRQPLAERNNASEERAKVIAKNIVSHQLRLARWLQHKSEKMSRKSFMVLFCFFSVLTAIYCILLICGWEMFEKRSWLKSEEKVGGVTLHRDTLFSGAMPLDYVKEYRKMMRHQDSLEVRYEQWLDSTVRNNIGNKSK